MEEYNSNTFNVDKICRLCLSQDITVTTIFSEDWTTSSLPIKIKECTSLEVNSNDGLPQNVCLNCLGKINEWFEFKNFCKESDTTLRRYLLEHKTGNAPEQTDIVSQSAGVQYETQNQDEAVYNSDEFSESDEKPLSQFKLNNDAKKVMKDFKIKSEHVVNFIPRGRTPKVKPICNICSKKFFSLMDLIEHRREKHEIKCDEENIKDEKTLEKLIIKDNIFTMYKCHVCKDEFNDREILKQHCSTKHDTKIIQPYPCSHCERQFSAWNLLIIHERKHTGEKPYTCDLCGKKNFISKTSLRRHKLIHLKVYSCTQCGKDFNCDSALRAHIRCKHTDEKPFLCNICGRSFSLSAMLAAHLTSHSNERKYVCDICGFASKTSGNHYRHKNTHNSPGLKLFHCEQCGKSFDNKLKLSAHQVIHRSVRPHVCNVCGKGFLYNNKLERHIMLVHARQRPFPCHLCGKKLASKFGLNIHLKTHNRNQNLHPKIEIIEGMQMVM